MLLFFRFFLALFLCLSFAEAKDWSEIESRARGQEVHWYAWGGSDLYNGYISWAGEQVRQRYGVSVKHVKLADTADAVRQVLAEKSSGIGDNRGAIDVIWINGENFSSMKRHGLLFGAFVDFLPNFSLIDLDERPTVLSDFTVATDGLEAPWGMAQLIFIYDSEYVTAPPTSPQELLAYAKANKGRITYPAPPDFLGTSFLKQLLLTLTPEADRGVFYKAPTDENFLPATNILWDYLAEIKPYLMRQGKIYPKSGQELLDLLDNRNIDMAFSFNVGAVSAAYLAGNLSANARPYVWNGGSLANNHFLAIPYNSKSKEGAQILINFLLSPEAQARKADSKFWGEPSVLSYHRLDAEGKKYFDALQKDPRSLSVAELGDSLQEPHPEWVSRIEAEWQKRLQK